MATLANRAARTIVSFRAASADEAIALAEAEAAEYAADNAWQYLRFAQCFHIFDRELASGTEVFSLLRDSDLSPTDYIDRYFDTGSEYSM
jgi:hypothetical protein